MKGTLVNVVAVLVGSAIGLAVGTRLSGRIKVSITSALGLVTLLIGTRMAGSIQACSRCSSPWHFGRIGPPGGSNEPDAPELKLVGAEVEDDLRGAVQLEGDALQRSLVPPSEDFRQSARSEGPPD